MNPRKKVNEIEKGMNVERGTSSQHRPIGRRASAIRVGFENLLVKS